MNLKKLSLSVLCVGMATLCLASAAQGAPNPDPLFVLVPFPQPPEPGKTPPPPLPPPAGYLFGPCGLGVDSSSRLYVSDYYHDAVDVYKTTEVNVKTPWTSYETQIEEVDTADGPCGLALNSSNQLYVNDFHRQVIKHDAAPSFSSKASSRICPRSTKGPLTCRPEWPSIPPPIRCM